MSRSLRVTESSIADRQQYESAERQAVCASLHRGCSQGIAPARWGAASLVRGICSPSVWSHGRAVCTTMITLGWTARAPERNVVGVWTPPDEKDLLMRRAILAV